MKKSKSTVLVGLQYGDEGKARVMDKLLTGYDVVARFNGGANAGHTLEVGKVKISLHQIPSGIFYKNMILYIGSGCVLNPEKTLNEIADIKKAGINISKRLKISGYTTLVQPHHILFDNVYGKNIGSTKNGIGPAYADRAMRVKRAEIKNIRLADYLADPLTFKKAVETNLIHVKKKYNLKDINVKKTMDKFHKDVLSLKQYLSVNPLYLEELASKGKNIFFEGAQSVMLDVVTGSTPYVTSSNTLAGAAYVGGDVSTKYHYKTIGVAKAIMSRVGNGPFITEYGTDKSEAYCAHNGGTTYVAGKEKKLYDPKNLIKSKNLFDVGVALRMLTGEYGATTKRPRRIGMFDLVMLRQNCRINGVDELYINKFDCLLEYANTSLKGIPMVVGYKKGNKTIDYLPVSGKDQRSLKPIVKYFPFLKEDITHITEYKDLPASIKNLIKFISKFVGTKVCGVGVGPKRNQFVFVP